QIVELLCTTGCITVNNGGQAGCQTDYIGCSKCGFKLDVVGLDAFAGGTHRSLPLEQRLSALSPGTAPPWRYQRRCARMAAGSTGSCSTGTAHWCAISPTTATPTSSNPCPARPRPSGRCGRPGTAWVWSATSPASAGG